MRYKLLTVVATIALAAGASHAFIDPDFTPVNLVEQSDSVALVEFGKPDEKGDVTAKVVKVYKGKPDKEMTFAFMAGAFEEKGKKIVKAVGGEHKQALIFVGEFEWGESLLHVGKDWVTLSYYADANTWDMKDIEAKLLGCWAGSDVMLRRAVEYIINGDDPKVPVKAEAVWGKPVEIGKAPGKVADAQAILLGKTVAVYVASDAGDRLITFAGSAGADITDKVKLTSRSQVACWADFNADGTLDLLSFDGKALSLQIQNADGTFGAQPLTGGEAIKSPVLSMASLALEDGKPAVLAGTEAGPYLLAIDGTKITAAALPLPEKFSELGKGGKALLADFDGDSIPDALATYAKGGIFYKGKANGQFEKPLANAVACGEGRTGVILGDYDMDGQFDVWISAEDANRFYHNVGEGKFDEMLAYSGEIEYISKRGGIGGITGDVNNDGRQDIMIVYDSNPPHVFFNRGFFSFGHAHELDVADNNLLPAANKGQQAGTLVDLNADGVLDMILVLKDGSVQMLPRKIEEDVAVVVRSSLPLCPMKLMAAQEKRNFGAYNLVPGHAGTLVGLETAGGAVTLKWQAPGAKEQSKRVFLEGEPQVLTVGADKVAFRSKNAE